MSKTFQLKRTKQCRKCPWKISTDPYDIPDGYCETKHRNLKQTIAEPGIINFSESMKVMACHHSDGTDSMYCVGWLNHQLGIGNNIMLRMQMLKCQNISQLKVYGPQHETFEETLPKSSQS